MHRFRAAAKHTLSFDDGSSGNRSQFRKMALNQSQSKKHRKSSRRCHNHADTGAPSHSKPSMCYDVDTSGTVFKQPRQYIPLPQDLKAEPKGLQQLNLPKDHGPKTRKPSSPQRNRRPKALKARRKQSIPNESALSGGDSPPLDEPPEALEVDAEMLVQPDTRPISHEQLVVEVKGIYAGLVMVEAKCIDIDERASSQERDPSQRIRLKNDQWQSLIALHKQLLHEHHDFFLASQHASASPALRRLAAEYSMPARMWRHGIHAFLEVLRHRLPESLEHMLAFIYIAYSMMALLYETVPTFEDTWIECLGDLGRYRMAIEDDEPKDREVWSNVARFWYNKAADKTPSLGRLYHHLAILARPWTLVQLSLYARSLTCITPFESGRGSIMTLINPILNAENLANRRSSFELIKAHGILFSKADSIIEQYTRKAAARYRDMDVYAAILEFVALRHYGGGYNTKKLRSYFPKLPGGPHSLLLEDLIVHVQRYFPGDWFESTTIDHEQWLDDHPSMAQLLIERVLRFSDHITSASWRILHTDYYSRIGQHAALVSKAPNRTKLSPLSSLLVTFIASCLPVVRGSPMGNTDEADGPHSITLLAPLLAAFLYVGLAAAVLAMARSLAIKRGPVRVWGSMMGISAYGWWAVRNDANVSPSVSVTDLGVWAISAYEYGSATFQDFRIPERVLLITLLGAVMLDMAINSFMTPRGAPISQSDLLSLSLPAMSLSLAITANLFGCFRTCLPSPPLSDEMEVGVSIVAGDPRFEDLLQQRPTIPYPDNSRHRLLGSPLNEDSTRIWETDD